MKRKTIVTIGLDIGSYSIKCVEVSSGENGIQLTRASVLPVLNPLDPSEQLSALDLGPSSKHVRVSVSGPSVLVRKIKMPLMTQAELKSAIRFEAESHVPFPIDDCALDFQILNQPDKKSMNVLLLAAKKDLIQERLKILNGVGIRPEVIDADILCLLNAFEAFAESAADQCYGILNIGYHESLFAIVQEASPGFVREIPLGGRNVTKAVMDWKALEEKQADELKIKKSPEHLPDLKAATQKGFEGFVEELRHSIDYFENEAGEELKTLYLSGGGAMSCEAPAILSEELGKAVVLWDNTKKIQPSGSVDVKFLSEHSAALNIALGLAVRGKGKYR